VLEEKVGRSDLMLRSFPKSQTNQPHPRLLPFPQNMFSCPEAISIGLGTHNFFIVLARLGVSQPIHAALANLHGDQAAR